MTSDTSQMVAAVPPGMGSHSPAEGQEWLGLSDGTRFYVLALLRWIVRVEQCPRAERSATIRDAVDVLRISGVKLSPSTFRRHYKMYTLGGRKANGLAYAPRDWRCLVPAYTNGKASHPRQFIDYLVSEYARTTRRNDAVRGVIARLYQDWWAGKEIPGYGTVSKWWQANRSGPMPADPIQRPQDLPEGWSERTLYRVLQKHLPRQDMRAAAQGQLGPENDWADQLLRDRSRLMPMQLWTIDDVRLDLQVIMPLSASRAQVVYVDALFAIDVATGMILGYGIKGKARREKDTEKGRKVGSQMSINAADVRHVVLNVLQTTGLPPYQTTLLTEMASAKLSGEDEIAFRHNLPSLAIEATGMGRGKLLASGYGQEWGRPGMKGWIESFFRLLHTRMNHLDGTTGRRYEFTRGDHADRVKATEAMLRRCTVLTPGGILAADQPLFEQLDFPLLELSELHDILGEVITHANWRINHRLQGFDRVREWRDADGAWRPAEAIAQLPATQRTEIEIVSRMEAPAERWQRLCTRLAEPFRPLTPEILHPLYAEHRKVTVRGEAIRFTDQRLRTDHFDFRLPSSASPDRLRQYENCEVLAYIPDDHSHAVLTDMEGRLIATLQAQHRVDLTDPVAIEKAAGETHRRREQALNHLRTYLGPLEDEHQARHAHNERVFAQAEGSSDLVIALKTARESHTRSAQAATQARRLSEDEADEYLTTSGLSLPADDSDTDEHESEIDFF